MGLRETAKTDTKNILEDVNGFGWPIRVTDPAGTFADMVGHSNDVADHIDPDTGLPISGRQASVALSMASLTTAGLGLPEGKNDAATKPWLVTFDDIDGTPFTFKVVKTNPDRTLGIVTCNVELYQ